jgi:hypothetical protein
LIFFALYSKKFAKRAHCFRWFPVELISTLRAGYFQFTSPFVFSLNCLKRYGSKVLNYHFQILNEAGLVDHVGDRYFATGEAEYVIDKLGAKGKY